MKVFRHSEPRLHPARQPTHANRRWHRIGLLAVLAMATSSPSYAQTTVAVTVVNMIPQILSGESRTDSEPNLAVNPANTQNIAASAFTPDPLGGPNAPIYVSTNGGQTWALNSIVPNNDLLSGTHDITLRFGSASNVLYAAILSGDIPASPSTGGRLKILRTNDFTSASAMTILVQRDRVDQPYLEAITVDGKDRVYVGNNDLGAADGKTATIDWSADAATAPMPAGFASQRIEARDNCGKNAPSVRPAIHADGTIYAAFFHWTNCPGSSGIYTTDVVVVRADNFAIGPAGFTALKEKAPPLGDGNPGVRVVTGRKVPFSVNPIGNQRVGSRIAIAVDPSNSQRVYLAWGDGEDTARYALYVHQSSDGGATWSADLRKVLSATNPSLAITSQGQVGFLYQKFTGTAANQRWETHLERTSDDFTHFVDLILHQAPNNVSDTTGAGPLGDYIHLMAVGQVFYGVFAGNNTPDMANFPQGVSYQRNVNFGNKKLLALDNVTNVDASIDPFFFKVQ
jgi:hypothetical protein